MQAFCLVWCGRHLASNHRGFNRASERLTNPEQMLQETWLHGLLKDSVLRPYVLPEK